MLQYDAHGAHEELDARVDCLVGAGTTHQELRLQRESHDFHGRFTGASCPTKSLDHLQHGDCTNPLAVKHQFSHRDRTNLVAVKH